METMQPLLSSVYLLMLLGHFEELVSVLDIRRIAVILLHLCLPTFNTVCLVVFLSAVRIGRIPNKQKETDFVDIEPYIVEDIKELDDSEILKEVVIDEDTEKLILTAGEAHKNTAKSYVSISYMIKCL